MRLLDRYLLRELLIPLGYCLGGFLIFFCAFDLISQLNHLQEQHLRFLEIVEYYVVTLPALLSVIVPVSLLLALLYTLTDHARHNEITAMRAAGVSLWRISLPYFGVGLCACIAVFLVNEFWVPQSAERADEILNRHQVNTKADRNWLRNIKFMNEPEHRAWDIVGLNTQTGEMLQPSVSWEKADGSRQDIYAQSAMYTNRWWVFHDVEEWDAASPRDQPSKSKRYKELPMPFPESPELMRSDSRITNMRVDKVRRPQFSLSELLTHLRLHPKMDPKKRGAVMTQLQGRIADPFTSLAVVLIALPFGAPSGRRNVFVGVASSIFICFSFLIMQQIFFGLGNGGYVPPMVAAWFPNAVFSLAGIVMVSRVK